MSFSSLGLSQNLVNAVEAAGYTTPSPVQLLAIPPALQGRYIQGLLYQYWESQAQQSLPVSHATAEHPIRLESDTVDRTDYLSAQAQLNNWKSLQTKT